MKAGDVIAAFRGEVVDTADPPLWTDEDVFRYLDYAYFTFVEKTQGIGDVSTEEVTRVPIVAGEDLIELHSSILTIRKAKLLSNGAPFDIINLQDESSPSPNQYGSEAYKRRRLIIGEERNKARFESMPSADDTLVLSVYRRPLEHIPSLDEEFELEIDDAHSLGLVYGMMSRAYLKQDADAYDANKAEQSGRDFHAYCVKVNSEWDRYKKKPYREVVYGGL